MKFNEKLISIRKREDYPRRIRNGASGFKTTISKWENGQLQKSFVMPALF